MKLTGRATEIGVWGSIKKGLCLTGHKNVWKSLGKNKMGFKEFQRKSRVIPRLIVAPAIVRNPNFVINLTYRRIKRNLCPICMCRIHQKIIVQGFICISTITESPGTKIKFFHRSTAHRCYLIGNKLYVRINIIFVNLFN